MTTTRRSFQAWQTARAANKQWTAKVEHALGHLKRTRPRHPDEARLLREGGTPERLIGPSEPHAETDTVTTD